MLSPSTERRPAALSRGDHERSGNVPAAAARAAKAVVEPAFDAGRRQSGAGADPIPGFLRQVPDTDADAVPPAAIGADHVGGVTYAAIDAEGPRVDHPDRLFEAEAQTELDPGGQQRRSDPRGRAGREAEASAFPDQRAADAHSVREVEEMLTRHRPPGRRHQSERTAMCAIRLLPDDVERVEHIVLIPLPALPVDRHAPAKASPELLRTIPEHGVSQKGKSLEFISI